jgi:hypothetical protein
MKSSTLLLPIFLTLAAPTFVLGSSASSDIRSVDSTSANYYAEENTDLIDLDETIASYEPELFRRPARIDETDPNNTQPQYLFPAKINSYDGGRPMVPSMIVNAYCTKEVPETVRAFCEKHRQLIGQLLKTPYPTTEKGETPFTDAQAGPVNMLVTEAWSPLVLGKQRGDEQAIKDAGLKNYSNNGGNYIIKATAEGQQDNWMIKISAQSFALSIALAKSIKKPSSTPEANAHYQCANALPIKR